MGMARLYELDLAGVDHSENQLEAFEKFKQYLSKRGLTVKLREEIGPNGYLTFDIAGPVEALEKWCIEDYADSGLIMLIEEDDNQ